VEGLGEIGKDEHYLSFNQTRDGSTDDAEWFIKVLKAAAGT